MKPSAFALTKPGKLRLYSTAELLKMPPPEWLIHGICVSRIFPTIWVHRCSVAYVSCHPASGKSGQYSEPCGPEKSALTNRDLQ